MNFNISKNLAEHLRPACGTLVFRRTVVGNHCPRTWGLRGLNSEEKFKNGPRELFLVFWLTFWGRKSRNPNDLKRSHFGKSTLPLLESFPCFSAKMQIRFIQSKKRESSKKI
jgi:hypothetical protein